MTRREEREALFALLYEMSFYDKEQSEDVLNTEIIERDFDGKYIIENYHGIINNLDELDELIREKSNGWKLSRLSKVTLSILRLSVYEMLFTDLHYTIAINEAVELAKKYDYEKSPSFVNGILNNIAEEKGLKEDK